jgi:hypothetical protein
MSSFDEKDELLLRQVHPSFIQDGRVTSQAFRPTPKDQKKLSVNRNSLISAQVIFEVHTKKKKLSSAGVWGVSVQEAKETPGLSLKEDPIEGPIEDLSHCLIDFSNIDSEGRIKTIASKLADKARSRGCLFEPLKEKT